MYYYVYICKKERELEHKYLCLEKLKLRRVFKYLKYVHDNFNDTNYLYTLKYFLEGVCNKCNMYLVKSKEEYIGTVNLQPYKCGYNIWCLSINKPQRGKGYTKDILTLCIKEKKRCKVFYLDVNKENVIAKHIYEQYGFKIRKEV